MDDSPVQERPRRVRLAESDVVFNVVWTGHVFVHLRPFVRSVMYHSDARFRFILNGCDSESAHAIEGFAALHPARVVDVVDVSPTMIAHGVALDRVRRTTDDGPLFGLIDPDVLATGPFLDPYLDTLTYADAVTAGRELWNDDNTVPPGHPGVAGEHFFDHEGFVFGSPHFALYHRDRLDSTVERWGVGFGTAGPDLTDHAADAIARLGFSYLVYDTGKLLNTLLQVDGGVLVHDEHPNMVHIGGLSHYLHPPAYLPPDEHGERLPDWTRYPTMAARHEVARFTAAVLEALGAGRQAPEPPPVADPALARKIATARETLSELVQRFGDR